MEDTLFGDEDDLIREELRQLLKVYSLEDILDENDLEDVDALFLLYRDGHIVLPETKPL